MPESALRRSLSSRLQPSLSVVARKRSFKGVSSHSMSSQSDGSVPNARAVKLKSDRISYWDSDHNVPPLQTAKVVVKETLTRNATLDPLVYCHLKTQSNSMSLMEDDIGDYVCDENKLENSQEEIAIANFIC